MIRAGEIFIVAYEGCCDGVYINLAISDCKDFVRDFQIQQLWPGTNNPTTKTSIAEEDNFVVINPAELQNSLNDLQKSYPELFL